MPSPFSFKKYGQSGMEVSDLFPHVAGHVDDIAFVRSVYGQSNDHVQATYEMQTGQVTLKTVHVRIVANKFLPERRGPYQHDLKRAAIDTAACLPAARIQDCIDSTYGDGALPVLFAYDDRLAGLYGDHYWVGNNGGAGGPFDAQPQRLAYMSGLTQLTDPAEFLAKSRQTPFGRVEGYVLAVQRNGDYRWVGTVYKGKRVFNFSPRLFDDPAWATCRSGQAIVLLDRDAHPGHS